MKLSPALDNLAHWDWSRVRVQLVMSIPGKYEGIDKMDEVGLCRLGSALASKGWRPKAGEVVKVEFQVRLVDLRAESSSCQSSSLGSYTIDWMDLFYQYCCGKTTRSLLRRTKPAGFPPIKVVFPSLATVDKSELGREVCGMCGTDRLAACD
jgi:tyrosyl-DNA phosphodiesterase-1